MLHKGELLCLATIGGEQPDLRFPFPLFLLLRGILTLRLSLTLRDEGQPFTIRRPARAVCVRCTHGKASRFTALEWYDPDRGTIVMFASIYRFNGKCDALPVW